MCSPAVESKANFQLAFLHSQLERYQFFLHPPHGLFAFAALVFQALLTVHDKHSHACFARSHLLYQRLLGTGYFSLAEIPGGTL